MINNYFADIFPFAYNYFSTMLDLVQNKEREFPQSIVFEGMDTKKQYLFALELARNLNCKNDKTTNCDCINCSWVKSLSHPAVQNVSQIHFKGEDDETKTVISEKQASEIEKTLLLSSDYHRFFIFFSSGEKAWEDGELFEFKKLGYTTEIDFEIKPLNHTTFSRTTLNALLKSVEEPPKNTTFIFLTKSKEDIIPTIVSRSVVFKLSSQKQTQNYNLISNIISKYPNIKFEDVYDISDEILKFLSDNQLKLEDFLNMFLLYLKDMLLANCSNDVFCQKINSDIEIINQAIKYSKAKIHDKIALETLLFRLARGY